MWSQVIMGWGQMEGVALFVTGHSLGSLRKQRVP